MSFDTSYTGTPLFLRKEAYADSHVKTAAITLSRDGADWEEQINQALHQEHPHIQDYNIQVNLSKSDPEHGAGIGTIRIDDKVIVPIIVEGFKLAPLDLFWYENDLHPLTRPSLERVLQETAIGRPVSPGQGEQSDVSLYSRTQPPFDGKYTYASADVANRDALVAALDKAFSTDGLAYELGKNELFKEAVARIAKSPLLKEAASSCDAPKGRLTVRKMRPFKKVASAGAYEIAAGSQVRPGLVFDVVFSPNGVLRNDTGFAVTIDKTAGFGFLRGGRDIGGRELDGGYPIPVTKPQGTGIFFSMNKVAACTEPITVDFEIGEDGEFAAHDALGSKFRLYKSAGIKAPFYAAGTLHIPHDWHWIKVGRRLDLMSQDQANVAFAPTEPHIAILNHGGRFTVRGLDGFSSEGDHYEKTAELLAERFHEDDVALVMKVASNEPALFLNYTKPKPVTKQATASVSSINLTKEASYIAPMRDFNYPLGGGHIKVAAVTDDAAKRTVDSLLSLNFLNPETLHKFADKLPHIEEAKTTVAKLLLASRLGLDVDSRPLRTAMYALDSVERDLRELQNAAEVEEQES